MLKVTSTACQHTTEKSFLGDIVDHPLITLNLLRDRWDEFSKGSLFVAYQMHERCNGNGYPRGLSAAKIHSLAKIAAVADAFTALVTDRPQRDSLLPFFAMKAIMQGIKDELYDPAVVRALFKTVSIHPLGSFVELVDGRMAQVIRTSEKDYCRPIVQIVRGRDFDGEPVIIDLSEGTQVNISKAIAEPELSEV
jgi:HD-GYP domain-containing protein (c-di-GMP phosphodiesterase class II)